MIIPNATYRLQLRNGMTFERAAGFAGYLAQLGISHLYLSPIFAAVSGSTHGYDVTDANRIDPALGGADAFEHMADRLRAAGLGLILDIVPNHMAASLENPWWRSAVEWGTDSPYACYFDIDWSRKLTLPILGRPFEEALAAGELTFALDRRHGALVLAYFGHLIPLHPASYADLLARLSEPLCGLIVALAAESSGPQADAFHGGLRALLAADSDAADRLEYGLDRLSRESDGTLRRVLDRQPWQLLHWQEAADNLSYRRFFEIAGLAGLRVEKPEVFEASHRLVLDLVRCGIVSGLRIDHIDGLSDPAAYLGRLREAVGPDVYIVVEKILAHGEALPRDWPVAGTTGYEFIAALSDLFVDDAKLGLLDEAYGALDPEAADFGGGVRRVRTALVQRNFATEVDALLRLAVEIAAREGLSVGRAALDRSLRALLIAFPVYRSYGTQAGLDAPSARLWDGVIASVAADAEVADAGALAFIDRAFRGDVAALQEAAVFRRRFQQLTGPLAAKAVEDTMFYRNHRLLGLNEVGCEPFAAIGGPPAFHEAMAERLRAQPHALSATATHDTKRGEDARARLYALSEAPEAWVAATKRWRRINADRVEALKAGAAPEPAVEWMLYQALAGIWPAAGCDAETLEELRPRFLAYVEKALREAEQRTRWGAEDMGYEAAVKAYAAGLLSPENAAFVEDFDRTLRPFVRAGLFNGLSQTLLKLTAPGVPDIYQGAEGLDFSLVDPDNRREPDFALLQAGLPAAPLTADEARLFDGGAKQSLVARALAFRRGEKALFASGAYRPLATTGERGGQAVAFLRQSDTRAAIVVISRFFAGLAPGAWPCGSYWGDTEVALPAFCRGRRLRGILDDTTVQPGSSLPLAAAFSRFPVTLLTLES